MFWVVMLLDVVLNCLLAACTTKRLAAMIGGAMGCAVAATIALSGHSAHAPLLLIVGGVVGFITGPLAYHLRQYFERNPIVIQVTEMG